MSGFYEEVREIEAALRQVFEPTPLQLNDYLSDRFGAEIWLKREDLSPVRSYKLRGAYSFFNEVLSTDAAAQLFVCASAGNHAQGFSHACRHFKKTGVIFMPVTTPQQKIMKTTTFGAPHVEIRLHGDSFDDANRAAAEFCQANNGIMVPPFDDPRIIRGQATVAVEILEQLPEGLEPDLVIMPVGGGGLAAGVTRVFEERCTSAEFCFVEPDGAASLKESLAAGARVELAAMETFVDGAAVKQVGAVNFDWLSRYSSDQVWAVPTNGVCSTMMDILNVEGIVLEPAGALSIDALQRLSSEQIQGRRIVCIVSGGNFDFERLPEVKERALKFSGLKKYFILRLPQRPGALKDFLFMLGPDDDIARFEYLKKSARNFGSILIGIETAKAANFDVLKEKLTDAGMTFQDITDNEIVSNLVI